MNLRNFLAFDVETATQKRSTICQIGYVIVKNLEIVDENSFLVKPPGNEYSVVNSNLHGLCALDTKNAPILLKVWKKVKKDFKSHTLVAHNASFDSSALAASLDHYNIRIPKLDCICTYQLTNLKLKSLCESLKIDLANHHDALSDAIACAKAMIRLIQGVEPDHTLIQPDQPFDPFAVKGHEKINGDVLKPNLEVEDKVNPFYSKKVVFTGVLNSISRIDAANILKDKGADIDTGVTKRTKYVIAGSGAGPIKLKKIDKYNQEGAEIEILNEETFLKMIK